jgi:hypothetical protein
VIVIKPELKVHFLEVFGNVARLPEVCQKRRVADISAKDSRPCWLGARGLVLLVVIAATPMRVVAAASSILLMPITCVDDVTRVVGVADAVMDG